MVDYGILSRKEREKPWLTKSLSQYHQLCWGIYNCFIKRIEKIFPILNEAPRVTITAGINDLKEDRNSAVPGEADMHIRHRGAGRKPIETTQPGILKALESLMESSTFGDPQSPLLLIRSG